MKRLIIILVTVLFATLLNAQIDSELDEVMQIRQQLQNRRELAAKEKSDYADYQIAEILIDLAYLHIDRKEYTDAIPLLEELLIFAADGTAGAFSVEAVQVELAYILMKAGNQYYDLNDFDTAEKYYSRSLKYFEKLAETDSSNYLLFMEYILIQIGNIYHNHRKNYHTAEKFYLRCLPISEKLVKEHKEPISNLSVVLRNIGLNYYELKRYRKAEQYYQRSLPMSEKAAQENPDEDLLPLVNLLEDMGRNYIAQKKYADGIKKFERALQICEQLVEKNVDLYLRRLAIANGNLSWGYLYLKEYSKSETAANQALELDDTQTWIKVNLAHAFLFQNRFSEVEELYWKLSQTIEKDDKTFLQTILDDFKEFKKAGLIPKKHKGDVEKIKKFLLNKELL